LAANSPSTASAYAPLTRPFCSQYLRTPAAFAALIFDTPGSAEKIEGADICAAAACDQKPTATMQDKDLFRCIVSAALSQRR